MAKYKIIKTNKYIEPPFKVGQIIEASSETPTMVIVMQTFEGKYTQFQFLKGSDVVSVDSVSENETNPIQATDKSSLKTKIVALSLGIGIVLIGYFVYTKLKSKK